MNHKLVPVQLDPVDAIELAELLEFLHDWTGFDTRRIGESLRVFSLGIYTLDDLRQDLARLAFLLGGTSHLLVNSEEGR